MTSLHFFHLEQLTQKFQEVLLMNSEIIKKRDAIQEKVVELKATYTDLVKHHSKKIFLFCLDTFYFQYKTLTLEMEHIGRSIALINNRMYGDYYKLYSIMLAQMTDPTMMDMTQFTSQFKKYAPYKELDPFQEYPIADTIQLHSDILEMIKVLYKQFTKKDDHAHHYHNTIQARTSITNFLHTLAYENSLLREQIALYVNYLEFFHSTQHTFLSKLFCKMDGFKREIEEDILNGVLKQDENNTDNMQLIEDDTMISLGVLGEQNTIVQDLSENSVSLDAFLTSAIDTSVQEETITLETTTDNDATVPLVSSDEEPTVTSSVDEAIVQESQHANDETAQPV